MAYGDPRKHFLSRQSVWNSTTVSRLDLQTRSRRQPDKIHIRPTELVRAVYPYSLLEKVALGKIPYCLNILNH